MDAQTAATHEIARSVQHAAKAAQNVSGNIAGVQQTVTDTGAAASQVLGSARDVSHHTAGLTGEVERFITEVQAA